MECIRVSGEKSERERVREKDRRCERQRERETEREMESIECHLKPPDGEKGGMLTAFGNPEMEMRSVCYYDHRRLCASVLFYYNNTCSWYVIN